MKRYRNLAIIAVVTTISLSTFYTKVAMSESKLPKFYLNTETGDSKYAKNMVINGGYGNRGLKITSDGSDYKNNHSFFGDINSDFFELKKLNKLQKEERNYMRGKNASSNFYIDKDFVWHADVKGGKFDGVYEHTNNHFKMYIDGLDRQNKDRYTFKVDIPGEEDYSYIYVDDVQLIGKDLVVITSQNKNQLNNNVAVDQNEKIMYRINVSQKKIVERKVINKSSNEQTIHTDIQASIEEADRTTPTKYYVYRVVKTKDEPQENGETTTEEVSNEVFVVNLETGKEEALKLSNEQKELVKQGNVLLDNGNLYIITHGEKGLSILKYSLINKKIEGQPISVPKMNGNEDYYKVLDGKLYAITNGMENPKKINKDIVITDLTNGKIIFEGNIKVKDAKGKSNQFLKELQVYEFTND